MRGLRRSAQARTNSSSVATAEPRVKQPTTAPRRTGSAAKTPLPATPPSRTSALTNITPPAGGVRVGSSLIGRLRVCGGGGGRSVVVGRLLFGRLRRRGGVGLHQFPQHHRRERPRR